jgi:hypothetical protein
MVAGYTTTQQVKPWHNSDINKMQNIILFGETY